MPTLVVETADLAGASRSLAAVGERLWSVVGDALSGAMSCTGMAGDDPAGRQWASSYSQAASAAAQSAQDVINATFRLSELLSATASNYANADAASTTGERHAVDDLVAALPSPTLVTLATRFDGVGGAAPNVPFGLSIVVCRVRMVWHDGHQYRLLRAAAAWQRSAGSLDEHALDVELACLDALRDDVPEGQDIHTACFSLAGKLRDVSGAHRSLARACEGLAHELDVAHSKVEHELALFLIESAAIQAAGDGLAFFTGGLSELPAQSAEAARIAAVVAEISADLSLFADAVGDVVRALPLVSEISARVGAALDELLSVRVVTAEVVGVPGLRVLSVARDARTVAGATSAGDEVSALGRLEVNATEVGEGGGHYIDPPTRVDVTDPKTFDPRTLEGMSGKDLADSIPGDWESKPSKSGGGVVYEDPLRRGRQIRIMPGYGPGVRSDPLTEGPYAVISQNGRKPLKVALQGNGVLK